MTGEGGGARIPASLQASKRQQLAICSIMGLVQSDKRDSIVNERDSANIRNPRNVEMRVRNGVLQYNVLRPRERGDVSGKAPETI